MDIRIAPSYPLLKEVLDKDYAMEPVLETGTNSLQMQSHFKGLLCFYIKKKKKKEIKANSTSQVLIPCYKWRQDSFRNYLTKYSLSLHKSCFRDEIHEIQMLYNLPMLVRAGLSCFSSLVCLMPKPKFSIHKLILFKET